MKQNKRYRLVGLFVLIGMVCFGLILSNYVFKKFSMNKDDLIALYFDESVRGLNVGSAVVYKGVEIGKVEQIKLLSDLYEASFKTIVFVSINASKNIQSTYNKDSEENEFILQNLVKKGLRARLITANYLTGQLMIEFLMDPDQPAVMSGNGEYPEVPTESSSLAMISKDLQGIPFKETVDRFGAMLDQVRKLTAHLDQVVGSKSEETTRTLRNFNATLEDISKASRSLKNLTDYLERHPEAIIQGKGKGK